MTLGPAKEWADDHQPLGQNGLIVKRKRKIHLPTLHLPVPRPGIGGEIDLPLLQKVSPIVEMDQHSVITVKDIDKYISLCYVLLRGSTS